MGAWSQHGNIMILREEGGPVSVKDYHALRGTRGLTEHSETDMKSSDTSCIGHFNCENKSQYSMSDYDGYSM